MKRRVEHHNKHLSNTVKLIITKDITTADFKCQVTFLLSTCYPFKASWTRLGPCNTLRMKELEEEKEAYKEHFCCS